MAKILSILSVVLLAGAAVLGFLNKGKLDTVRADLATTSDQLQLTKKEKEDEIAAKKKAIEDLAGETAKREQAESEAQKAQASLKDAEGKVAALTIDVETKQAEIADLNTRIAAASSTPGGTAAPGESDELQLKLTELQTALAAAEEEKKILTTKVESERASAESLRVAEQKRLGGLMQKGLEGKILAYNPAWNFVVLNLGDRNGVVKNAEMVVKRDGQMVGKIKISSVEPSTSIADVEASSVPRGLQIQPGDRVIVPGS